MNENNVRALLHDLADRPEPAPRIDIDRARRRGLRRLWARRAAVPGAPAMPGSGLHAASLSHSAMTTIPGCVTIIWKLHSKL